MSDEEADDYLRGVALDVKANGLSDSVDRSAPLPAEPDDIDSTK